HARAGAAAHAGPHATSGAAPERLAEQLAEDVAGVDPLAVHAGSAELEMRAAGPGAAAGRALGAAEGGEGIAAAAGSALEAGETLLAGCVDLAAVELAALFLVADDLVGLVDLGEAVLGLGIVRVLVRMVFLSELAERGLDVLR